MTHFDKIQNQFISSQILQQHLNFESKIRNLAFAAATQQQKVVDTKYHSL